MAPPALILAGSGRLHAKSARNGSVPARSARIRPGPAVVATGAPPRSTCSATFHRQALENLISLISSQFLQDGQEPDIVVTSKGMNLEEDAARIDRVKRQLRHANGTFLVLSGVAETIKNFVLIYHVDITKVPDFNTMYELYDPSTVMFFFRNKHIMIDLGTRNNNKINWAMKDKEEFVDIVETVYRGARKAVVW
ncbi:hypothetical protein CFC21_043033 [Triticum aestivum]|uniref:Uncharacterized protein n=2 Tax=Triticum aestivum TaxID=4565 RepID=A0A9R1FMZ8_WHEAT|nr:hypothetical protein CFC21_043033 [Triticum aestivum]